MHREPYILSKMDIAALRKATHLSVHYLTANDTKVRAIKENRPSEKNPFAQDIEYVMPIPVTIQYSYNRDTSRAVCHELLWLYPQQNCRASSVLATLKAGDGVAFVFYPDAHTNGYMESAGLHGDMLRLNQFRNGKLIAQWEIGWTHCQENSARMCRNVFKKELTD